MGPTNRRRTVRGIREGQEQEGRKNRGELEHVHGGETREGEQRSIALRLPVRPQGRADEAEENTPPTRDSQHAKCEERLKYVAMHRIKADTLHCDPKRWERGRAVETIHTERTYAV